MNINWTKLTTNPCDGVVTKNIDDFFREITKSFTGHKTDLISSACAGKAMLDIGAGEHDLSYFNEKWEHAIYKKGASRIVAVEIEKSLCDYYNAKGFDFRCIDATSDQSLGEEFEFVYCGDVIEHVDNAVALVKFMERHMSNGARCFITTPNPCFLKFKNMVKPRNHLYFMSNLQHVSWIVPSHMFEIIRRTGSNLELESIFVPQDAVEMTRSLGGNLEDYFEDFIYVLKKPEMHL